jgi:hypothetical protein
MRRYTFLVPALLLLADLSSAKDLKVHGFVTAVNSPSSFEIDDYKITHDLSLTLDVKKTKSDPAVTTFKHEDIRVGTELEITGDYNESTHELKARSIEVFLFDTVRINRFALLEKSPTLEKSDSGAWHGTLFADERVAVSEATVVTLKTNAEEREAAKTGKKNKRDQSTPLTSLDDINLDTFVHYEGTSQPDGSVLATKVEFEHAELAKGEADLWKKWTPKVKEPDYAASKPGQLKMAYKKYKILADREAQEYVSGIGESLIPQHQKDLPPGSPLKIPFRFYLVNNKVPDLDSFGNGTVVVNSGLFDILENEAQLAFLLEQQVAEIVEKEDWRDLEYHKRPLKALELGEFAALAVPGLPFALVPVAKSVLNGDEYARSLQNQADRVGMEWTLASGYDIREAPKSWKALSLKGIPPENVLWTMYEARRSYAVAELKIHYSSVDYSNLKKDSDDFHRIAQKVQVAEKGK